MHLEGIIQEVVVIEQLLKGILEEDGLLALHQARADLKTFKTEEPDGNGSKRKTKKKRSSIRTWSLRIPPGNPLRFVRSGSIHGHTLSVDLFCHITQPVGGIPQGNHNIVIRVWTEDEGLWFRDGMDSEALFDKVVDTGGRRVMHRVHFDFANPGQAGPRFHLQFGGTQHGNEFCWIPESLEVPRYPHYPLCLITACEFIARTFFPEEYFQISSESTWIGAIRAAQDAYITPYVKQIVTSPSTNLLPSSMLDRLWNPV